MQRFTVKDKHGEYEISDIKGAIDALAKFEDLYEYAIECETTIPQELEELRADGKTKSYKFREAMGRKLTNTAFLNLFERFGIK